MGFEAKKFLNTKWTPRVEAVPVPDLREFFKEGSPAEWKVRGLTGQEMGRADEAARKNQNVLAVIKALAGESDQEKINAIKGMFGASDDVTEAVAKRIAYLTIASVDPVCTEELAVRMCEVFPVEFFDLTQKILALTGKGQLPGKLKPSGAGTTSEPVLPSATPGGDSSTKPVPTASPKASSRKRN